MDNRFADRPAPSSAWMWQAATGVALLVLLAIHMIAQHFVVDTEGGLRNHADVVAYIGNPLVFAIEALFLVVVTIHAVLGVRAILFDFGLSARAEARVTRALQILGGVTVAYGIWLLVAIA